MNISDRKPNGTNTGFVRLQKFTGSCCKIVDMIRYELSSQCVRFREENWISSRGTVVPSGKGRNTDDFHEVNQADEFFARWLKVRLEDRYTIVDVGGRPGPLPVPILEHPLKEEKNE